MKKIEKKEMSHQNQENFFNNLNFTNQRNNNLTDSTTLYQNLNASTQAQSIGYQQTGFYSGQQANNNGTASIQGKAF